MSPLLRGQLLRTAVCGSIAATFLLTGLFRTGDWLPSWPRPVAVMSLHSIYRLYSSTTTTATSNSYAGAASSSIIHLAEEGKIITGHDDLGPPAGWHQAEFDVLLTREVEVTRGQVWVKYQAPLLTRIEFYNGVLAVYRQRTLTLTATSPSNVADASKWPADGSIVDKVYWNQSSFLGELTAESTTATTVYLQYLGTVLPQSAGVGEGEVGKGESGGDAWDSQSPQMAANILLQQYYDWNGSSPLCSWLAKDRWQWNALRASACVVASKRQQGNNVDRQSSAMPTSMGAHLYQEQMIGGPGSAYISYIHIVQWGTLTSEGHVFVRDSTASGSGSSSYKLVTPVCFYNRRPNVPHIGGKVKDADKSQPHYYDEVFSICQSLGQFYYHKMIEQMPRLAPFVTFLRRFPSIRIHVAAISAHTDALLRALDLDPDRLITGNVRARVVYIPRSTPCGRMRLIEGQLLSREYRQYIEKKFNSTESPLDWNSVIFIQRSGKRQFRHQATIRDNVKTLAERQGFRFEVFADNPAPSAEETMRMFHTARVVVGPHGAGLSNTVFSRPGTYVIEGVCEFPNTNVCYLQQSYELGLIYHGVPSRGGCDGHVDADPHEVMAVLTRFLQQIRNNNQP